jgi:hypothetical protein
MILKRDRDRRVHERPQKCSGTTIMIKSHIWGHFCEDAYGRNGHGHA